MAIKDLTKMNTHLFLCNGQSCKSLGAEESTSAIRAAIVAAGISEEVHTTKTLCNGRCKDGPVVISMPDGIWFRKMNKEIADLFVRKYLQQKMVPVEHFLFKYGLDDIYSEEEQTGMPDPGGEEYSKYF